jgi:hypothetical protein
MVWLDDARLFARESAVARFPVVISNPSFEN